MALTASATEGVVGAAYTMTNAADGNEVVIYDRLADGTLRYVRSMETGGEGSGDGLGNQGGVVLSDDGRWLLVVNAGSNEISVFTTTENGLAMTDVEDSGGVRPVSVAIHRDLIYVVHAGGDVGDEDSIASLRLSAEGALIPLPDSSYALSADSTGPAQVGFSKDGHFVLVTEKATNLIDVFPLDADGYAIARVENPSAGPTPFAFDFRRRDQLFVSEVGGGDDGGAVSSYTLGSDGLLQSIDPSVPNTETAPCWLVVTKDGRYVFTANTPDDSLSGYAIDAQGFLELLDPGGRTGEPGAGTRPLDIDLSDDGRFLYSLNIGNNTISAFRIGPHGSLTHLGFTADIPEGSNGLAAR